MIQPNNSEVRMQSQGHRRGPSRRSGRILPLAAVLAVLWLLSAATHAACGQDNDVLPGIMHMDAGVQKAVEFPTNVERVAVGDPSVADIEAIDRRKILVTAIEGGSTSLYVWTRCSPDPDRSVLLVSGRAAMDVHEVERSREQVADLPMQVQTDIRLVEVSRSRLRELGASMLGRRASSNFMFGSPRVVDGRGVPGAIADASSGIPGSESGFNIFYGGGGSRFLALLTALEASDFAYTLAEPSLVALSGQSATFHAGGEFPVPVPSAGSDSISVQFREFGVRVSLTPTVIDRDRLTLKVAPEVSELDPTAGVTINGTTVPGVRVRRTDTTVSLGDGESFVISGLVSSNTASQVDKLPGLGDLPVLGAFFRSSRVTADDRELLMIVTPHLVRPFARDAELPELPGEAYRHYRPGVAQQFFLEDGRFDPSRFGQSGLWHGN